MKTVAFLACLAGASAFAPAATVSKTTALNSVFDDYVGAVDFRGKTFEFDPLKLSETYSPFVPFFREAELRHGRTAMLAVLGLIWTDVGRLPGDMYSFENIPKSVDAYPILKDEGPMIQVLAWVGLFDLVITLPAIAATFAGERDAGDFGWVWFGPEDSDKMDKKRESELLNGRLAMIAVGGIVTQSVLADKGFPYLY